MNLEINVPEQSSASPALYFADKETEPREGPCPRCFSGRVRSWPKLPSVVFTRVQAAVSDGAGVAGPAP